MIYLGTNINKQTICLVNKGFVLKSFDLLNHWVSKSVLILTIPALLVTMFAAFTSFYARKTHFPAAAQLTQASFGTSTRHYF